MAKKHRPGTGDVADVNMTPMIDCTFQLIIFFILTAQMATETAKVLVAKPLDPMALCKIDPDKPPFPNKITVNVVNKYGDKEDGREPSISARPECYIINNQRIETYQTDILVQRLQDAWAAAQAKGLKSDEFFVEIRADKDIAYAGIEPVLMAAAEAKLHRMTITAEADKKKQKDLQAH